MIADDRIRARFLKETAQLCMDENRVRMRKRRGSGSEIIARVRNRLD